MPNPNGPQAPPLRLSNPYLKDPDTETICVRIPRSIYQYFFNHILAGSRGSIQAIQATLIKRLYEECQLRGISAVYDPDGEALIANILNELTFNRPTPPRRRATGSTSKRPKKSDAAPGK